MTRRFAALLLATSALAPAVAHAQAVPARALPTGGTVAAGSARIGPAGATGMTITQTSDRAIINWQGFAIGEGKTVDIRQPDVRSVLLNRVTGDAPSTIAGTLSANGQVFLVNPNGIVITRSGTVRAAGFVASTLDIADDAFMRGDIVVSGRGGRVSNAGSISIVSGGYAALIGGQVDNSGTILAPLGRVALGSARRATLDLAGDQFLQIALPADDGAVAMSGRISADGGAVLLSAASAVDAARHTVNLSGVIEARGVSGRNGSVTLSGGEVSVAGGRIDLSGESGGGTALVTSTGATTVDAASRISADATASGTGGRITLWSDGATTAIGALSARGVDGGGFIETSGATVGFTGLKADASSRSGKAGTWLIDPDNLTVDSNAAATISSNLANASVTLQTTSGGASGLGTSSAGVGDIIIDAAIGWSSTSTLTLDAYHGIAVNADITVGGAGTLALKTNDGGTGGDYRFNGASVDYGTSDQGGKLSINGQNYTLLYTMAAIDAIDTTGPAGRYALATSLDALGTTYDHALVGVDYTNPFTGTFTGLGHTISSLTINAPGSSYIGLFGVAPGTVRDIGLIGGSVSGGNYVGGLIGDGGSATVSNAYATGAVSGSGDNVGGLIGYGSSATVSNAWASGSVSGSNFAVGGLIGDGSSAKVSNAYATGAVSGSFSVGGLIGYGDSARVSNAYATGAVSGSGHVGGLIGFGNGATLGHAYFDTDTSGQSSGIGTGTPTSGTVTGLTTAQLQSGSATFDGTAFAGGTGGLYPYLASFYPNGVQAISGTAYGSDGAVLRAGSVTLYQSGTTLGTAKSGANGYYYLLLGAGAAEATAGLGGTLTAPGTATPGGFSYRPTAGSGTVWSGFDLTLGLRSIATAATSSSALDTMLDSALQATFGATTYGDLATSLASANTAILAANGFTIDSAITSGGDLTIRTGAGDITVDSAIDWTGGHTLTLDAYHGIAVNADITVGGAGTLALKTNDGGTGGDYRFNGASVDYGTSDQGGKLSINGDAYTLLYAMADIDKIDTSGLAGRYALATSLDALGTTYDHALVGVDYTNPFTGTFTGLGHTISSLTIAAAASNSIGLFSAASGTVRDIGLIGGSVSGSNYVGGLIGDGSSATVSNAYATGAVSGSGDNVGGLIGYGNYATVSNAWATGAVSGSSYVGGLIGSGNSANVSNAYATGAVSGSGIEVGGLIGYGPYATVSNAHATGAVSGSGNVGGLIGFGYSANVSNAYFDTDTSGQSSGIGAGTPTSGTVTGLTTAKLQSGSATFDGTAFAGGTGGLYPYLASFYPNGVQAISGMAYDAAGAKLRAGSVTLYQSGTTLGTAKSGANGYYYLLLGAGAAEATAGLGGTLTASGASAAGGFSYRPTAGSGTVWSGFDLTLGLRSIATAATSSSALDTMLDSALQATFGATTYGNLATSLASANTAILAANGFTIDSAITSGGDLTIDLATGDLGIASGGTAQSSNGDVTLITRGAFTNQAGAGAVAAPNGRWLIYAADPATSTFDGLDSSNTALWNVAAGAAVTATGNRYAFGWQPTLTLGATDTTKTYGDTVDPGSAYTIAGLMPGITGAYLGDRLADIVTGTPVLTSTGSAVTAGVGDYTISLDSSGLSVGGGYKLVTTGSGTLHVTPRGLTVTADPLSRIYGDDNPALTYASSGLVNGDTLSGALATTADARSDVGGYAITQGTLAASSNYALTYVGANLTITPRGLTVTADALSRIYGDDNPALSYASSGLVNGDTLSGALATTADTRSNVGGYAITQGTLAASSNYALTYVGANLTITPRGLTVTADALSRIYGDDNPALTYASSGLVNGDTLSGALATTADTRSNVGGYAITQGTLAANSNYVLTYLGANLTITPRVATVTADPLSRIYGDDNPALTYASSGLVNGDTLSGALATEATRLSLPGDYAITRGTLTASDNYTLQFTPATLTVNNAATLTAQGTASIQDRDSFAAIVRQALGAGFFLPADTSARHAPSTSGAPIFLTPVDRRDMLGRLFSNSAPAIVICPHQRGCR